MAKQKQSAYPLPRIQYRFVWWEDPCNPGSQTSYGPYQNCTKEMSEVCTVEVLTVNFNAGTMRIREITNTYGVRDVDAAPFFAQCSVINTMQENSFNI